MNGVSRRSIGQLLGDSMDRDLGGRVKLSSDNKKYKQGESRGTRRSKGGMSYWKGDCEERGNTWTCQGDAPIRESTNWYEGGEEWCGPSVLVINTEGETDTWGGVEECHKVKRIAKTKEGIPHRNR